MIACKDNNEKIVRENVQGCPERGGNRAALMNILGNSRVAQTVESAMYTFTSTSGTEFIALQLLIDWEEFS